MVKCSTCGNNNRESALYCSACGTRLANVLAIGDSLASRYRIVGRLEAWEDGFALAYLAMDETLNCPCTIKQALNPLNITERHLIHDSIDREFKILALLSHPSLLKVHEIIHQDANLFMVIEFVEGSTLQDILEKQGILPINQVLAWANQLCDVISYLHRQNPPIIQRNVKPKSIIVEKSGYQIRLINFEMAGFYEPGRNETPWGTPGYSPPEQYRGETDQRSDIYSFGATLYQLLTGRYPPDALALEKGTEVLALRQFNPAISSSIEGIILRAMAVQPSERFQSMDEMRFALQVPPAMAITVTTPSPQLTGKTVSREATLPQIITALGTLAAFSVAVGGIYTAIVERPAIAIPVFLSAFATCAVGICIYLLFAKEEVERGFLKGPNSTEVYFPKKYRYCIA